MINPEFEEKAKARILQDEEDKVKRMEAIKERILQEDRDRESLARSIKLWDILSWYMVEMSLAHTNDYIWI